MLLNLIKSVKHKDHVKQVEAILFGRDGRCWIEDREIQDGMRIAVDHEDLYRIFINQMGGAMGGNHPISIAVIFDGFFCVSEQDCDVYSVIKLSRLKVCLPYSEFKEIVLDPSFKPDRFVLPKKKN